MVLAVEHSRFRVENQGIWSAGGIKGHNNSDATGWRNVIKDLR